MEAASSRFTVLNCANACSPASNTLATMAKPQVNPMTLTRYTNALRLSGVI